MIFKVFSRKWILTTILVVAGAAVCVRLGIWQLDRLSQRRSFNAHVFAVQAMPTLDLPASDDMMAMEYRMARASGTYDFENQVAIRNQFYNDQYGFHLLTPLRLPDGEAVLVDRGWIPADGNAAPADWRNYDLPGEVTVSGIIRLSQTVPTFGGVPDPTLTPDQTRLDFWVYVNIERIAQQLPYRLLPIYLQPAPDPNRTDPPFPFQPTLDLSEGPHQGYALQWFSFAAILLVGYPFYLWKQETGKP